LKEIIYIIILMFLPIKIQENIKFIFLNNETLDNYIIYNKNSIVINTKEYQEEKIIKDYFDISNNYYIIYDKMGTNLELYKYKDVIKSFKSSNNYPRIINNFLFLFSSDMMSVKVFSIDELKELFNISTNDIITSYNVSKNNKYIIIGNMSGDLFIYDTYTKKPFRISIKESKNNYIRSLYIDDEGNFTGIGGIYPDIIFKGSITTIEKNKIKTIKMPTLPRKKIYIKTFDRTIFTEDQNFIYIINDKNETMNKIHKTGTIFDILKKDNNEYVIIEKKENIFYIKHLINTKVIYIVEVNSDYYPLADDKNNLKILFHKIGSLTW